MCVDTRCGRLTVAAAPATAAAAACAASVHSASTCVTVTRSAMTVRAQNRVGARLVGAEERGDGRRAVPELGHDGIATCRGVRGGGW